MSANDWVGIVTVITDDLRALRLGFGPGWSGKAGG